MGSDGNEDAKPETGDLNVLVVGSGPLLASLEAELRILGEFAVQVCLTGSASGEADAVWRSLVLEADWVLFGSGEQDLEKLRALEKACRQAGKPLLPAVIAPGKGVAGPLSDPDSDWGWEAAWRRLRPSALGEGEPESVDSAAAAMLANLMVTEWLKEVTKEGRSLLRDRLYLLDLRTVEGAFHPFEPHPLAAGWPVSPRRLEWDRPPEPDEPVDRDGWAVFSRLTSPVNGIFHVWDEGDLRQLPLASCRVQAVDPCSADGASLLPEAVCAGLTQRAARIEAGLTGIEAYASRLANPAEWFGIGVGFSMPEAFNRALSHGLARYSEQAGNGYSSDLLSIQERKVGRVEDVFCRYGLQALAIENGTTPLIGEGETTFGFPSMWVQTRGIWCGSAGLNRTLALRSAIQQALLRADPPPSPAEAAPATGRQTRTVEIIDAIEDLPPLSIPVTDEMNSGRLWEESVNTIQENGYRLSVYDIAAEPFLRHQFAGVVGLLLEEVVE